MKQKKIRSKPIRKAKLSSYVQAFLRTNRREEEFPNTNQKYLEQLKSRNNKRQRSMENIKEKISKMKGKTNS